MSLLIDILSWFLLIGGAFFGVVGAVGTVRFPDFYTRLHASSVADTMCAGMILSGLALQAGFTLVTVKLFFILIFLWYTSPAASHAMVRAAYLMGVKPYLLSKNQPQPDKPTQPNEKL